MPARTFLFNDAAFSLSLSLCRPQEIRCSDLLRSPPPTFLLSFLFSSSFDSFSSFFPPLSPSPFRLLLSRPLYSILLILLAVFLPSVFPLSFSSSSSSSFIVRGKATERKAGETSGPGLGLFTAESALHPPGSFFFHPWPAPPRNVARSAPSCLKGSMPHVAPDVDEVDGSVYLGQIEIC